MSREATLKRRIIVYVLILLFLSATELIPGRHYTFFHPDFLLALPIVTGLWISGYDGMVMGLFCGFILDFTAGRGYGAGSLFLMMVGLLASRIAPVGTRLLLLAIPAMTIAATMIQTFLFGFLSWLIPLASYERSLSQSMGMALRRLPSSLLSNIAAAVIVAFLFFIGFYKRKKKDGSDAITLSFSEGERLDV
ncbi:MAG: rod shape-determining protein MreD [Clostridiaceae bacterium]|jgi:cell shape-determining protein MreD|nr:rod shape-determining protein MreD [Clostridiaceae bacterium]